MVHYVGKLADRKKKHKQPYESVEMLIRRGTLSEIQVTRQLLRISYYDFVKEFWEYASKEKPRWNWHIKVMCDEIQKLVMRVKADLPREHDLIVNVPPGMTKSIVFSVCLVPWVWTFFPTFRCIAGSYGFQLSLELSRKSKDLILSDKYQELFPHIKLRDDQRAKGHWMNTRGGSRYATSVGGSVTGMHAHLLVVDDPIDPNDAQALSAATLNAANNWMSETLPTRKVDKEVVPTVIVMQRLHMEDPSGVRLASRHVSPVRHICLPADCEEYEVKPRRYKKKYKNGLLDPKRLPRRVLREQQHTLGPYGYAGQYGQNPIPRTGGLFDVSCLHYVQRGSCPRMRRLVRYWDKAGTKGAGKRTAGVLVGDAGPGHSPRYYVLDVVKFQEADQTREATIRRTAMKDGQDVDIVVEQEPGSGGKDSARYSIRGLAGFRVRADKVTGEKMLRAQPLADQVAIGNVAVIEGSPWTKEFVEEMRVYGPTAKFKDQVDAAAGGMEKIFRRPLIFTAS